jgi:hypothetical protein
VCALSASLKKEKCEMRGMKRRFRFGVGSAGVVLAAALCFVLTLAFGQNSPAPAQGGKAAPVIAGGFDQIHPLPQGGPAPRMADGHVDLSGRYYPNRAGRMLEGAYPVDPAVRGAGVADTAARETQPVFKPGMAAKYKSPVPYGECDQAGTPSSITMQANQHGPLVLMQTPGMITMLSEYPLTVRMVHTDGRPHQKDPDPTFSGDSTAHWDGDTLVVDAIAIDTKLRNVAVGFTGESGAWFHSDMEHVIERFTRPSKNYLTYQVTIEDPVVLEKPWSSQPRTWSLSQDPNDDWAEYFCTHNEEPDEYKKIGSPTLTAPNFGGGGGGGRGRGGARGGAAGQTDDQ